MVSTIKYYGPEDFLPFGKYIGKQNVGNYYCLIMLREELI